MIFAVQRFLEDYFQRRALADVDQYAVRIANAFYRASPDATQAGLARDFARVRTVFYRRNRQLNRRSFETELAATLKVRFKKKANDPIVTALQGAVRPARIRLAHKRRSIGALLGEFQVFVQARAIDVFWKSRKKGALRPSPEQVAQSLLAAFAQGVLGRDGYILREMASGIGFVDIAILFGKVLHLIELKILQDRQLVGPSQLGAYMRTEQRRKGWLVLIDSRPMPKRTAIPSRIDTTAGAITTVVVDVNPTPPNIA